MLPRIQFNRLVTSSVVVLAVLGLVGCGSTVKNPVTGQKERTVMSEQSEVEEGRKAHAEILKEYSVLQNPGLQSYVNDIGQRMARLSHRSNLQWTFTVLDSPEINAFAIPGGYVYVTRGIMAYLDSEADLAGILGHEIGHVTARHGAQRATRARNAQIGAILGTVAGVLLESRGVAGAAQGIGGMSQTAAAGYVARYGREQELQADGLGAEYLSRVSYDPRNMIDVIRVLSDQEKFSADLARAEGRPVPEGNPWLASHPTSQERLQAITALAARYQQNKAYADEGRVRFLQYVNSIRFGESPEQGLTRGNNFYHEGLNFAFTAAPGFRILNNPSEVVVVNGTGDAALIIDTVPPNAGKTHDEAIRKLINPDSGRTERINLNGLSASRFVGTRVAQGGQRVNAEATFVTGPNGQMFMLRPAAKDAAVMSRYRTAMFQIEQSFRPLSNLDRTNARPWVIRTVQMPRGGFAELARSSPLSNAEAQLRLINGVYSTGSNPAPGSLVKVIMAQ